MEPDALFVGWGQPFTGKEQTSLPVFQDALQYLGGLQQGGGIDSFDAVGLESHGGELQGFLLIRADAERLNRMRYSKEWTRLVSRGLTVVSNFGVVSAWTNDNLAQFFAQYQQDIEDLV